MPSVNTAFTSESANDSEDLSFGVWFVSWMKWSREDLGLQRETDRRRRPRQGGRCRSGRRGRGDDRDVVEWIRDPRVQLALVVGDRDATVRLVVGSESLIVASGDCCAEYDDQEGPQACAHSSALVSMGARRCKRPAERSDGVRSQHTDRTEVAWCLTSQRMPVRTLSLASRVQGQFFPRREIRAAFLPVGKAAPSYPREPPCDPSRSSRP